jgi:ABC-2 type transport system permease protein
MLRRVLALILKELLVSARDRRTRAVVLFAPPLLILVYAFAITQEVEDAAIAVLDRDDGLAARELTAAFEHAAPVGRVIRLHAVQEIGPILRSREAAMVIHLGPEFSERLARGEPAQVQILLDGRRSNAAQILLGYAGRIVEAFARERAGRGPPAPVVRTRIWFNPNAEALWFALPSLFAVMAAIVAFMVSALAIARERELGTFDQLLVSPLRPVEILAGKTLPALLIALTSATAMLLLGVLVLGVPFRGSPAALYLALVVYLAANIGIGLFISSLAATQQQAVIGLFLYMMPAVLLSGYATPVENMPGWLQGLTQGNPITHFLILSRGLFLKDIPAGVVLAHVWPLALIAAATLTAGAWLFRRRLA